MNQELTPKDEDINHLFTFNFILNIICFVCWFSRLSVELPKWHPRSSPPSASDELADTLFEHFAAESVVQLTLSSLISRGINGVQITKKYNKVKGLRSRH